MRKGVKPFKITNKKIIKMKIRHPRDLTLELVEKGPR